MSCFLKPNQKANVCGTKYQFDFDRADSEHGRRDSIDGRHRRIEREISECQENH